VALKDEIKRRNAFARPEQEAYLNLLRTGTALFAGFERLFRQAGLSEPQYNVLRILRGAGGQGLPSTEIAGRMITRVPDVTRLVDRLVSAGLVARSRTAADRRVVIVKATKKALDLLAALDGPLVKLHREQLGHLTRAELAELNRLLVKAREATDGGAELTCDGTEGRRGRER
jgi:DNA-binding MarR family transcriptional regulator